MKHRNLLTAVVLLFSLHAAFLPPRSAWAMREIAYRCTVFAADAPIGEVRVVQRDGAVVLQTLLQTVLMRRVVAEIRKKEEANWPSDRPGSESSQRYVAALERVQRLLWQQRARSTRGPNPPQRLAIEFVQGTREAWVGLGTFELQGNPTEFNLSALRLLERLDLDRRYIGENIRLILADACHLDQDAIDRLLRSVSTGQPTAQPQPE